MRRAGIATLLLAFAPSLLAGPVAVIEPAFYHQKDRRPIRDSAKTVVAFYNADGPTLTPHPPDPAPEAEQTLTAEAMAAAGRLASPLDPEVARDAGGVVVALRFHSADPALSSVLLLPDTWRRYAAVLGPDCLATVPNRETLLLLPRLGGSLQSFAVEVVGLYRNSPYPGSTEAFEWRDGAPRAIHDFLSDLVD